MKLSLGEDFFVVLENKMNKNLASKINVEPTGKSKKNAENDLGASSVSIKPPPGKTDPNLSKKSSDIPI